MSYYFCINKSLFKTCLDIYWCVYSAFVQRNIMSPSDTDSTDDRALLLLLRLLRETGTDDFSATLIFVILSLKKCPKVLAKSVGLM